MHVFTNSTKKRKKQQLVSFTVHRVVALWMLTKSEHSPCRDFTSSAILFELYCNFTVKKPLLNTASAFLYYSPLNKICDLKASLESRTFVWQFLPIFLFQIQQNQELWKVWISSGFILSCSCTVCQYVCYRSYMWTNLVHFSYILKKKFHKMNLS